MSISRGSTLATAISVLLIIGARICAADDCREDISESDGYTIRQMTVDAWWPPKVDLPVGPYSPAKVSEAIRRVGVFYSEHSNEEEEFQNIGAVSSSVIDACVRIVDQTTCVAATGSPLCVDVAIQPHAVRFYLFKTESNIIPVPRFNRATWFQTVPAPMRALNPALGFAYDREYGPSESASISTDLLDAPSLIRGQELPVRADQLRLDLGERASFSDSFYDVDGRLVWRRSRPGSLLAGVGIDAVAGASREPLGNMEHEDYGASFGARLELNPQDLVRRSLHLGTQFHWTHNEVTASTGKERNDESAGLIYAIGDARLGEAFTRLALWGDIAGPTNGGVYERFAGMLGAQRDFPVGTNQDIGVEVLVGGGHTWGNTPEYARFFGGNSARNFLYDAATSRSLTDFPSGPLIRSFGEAQAGVRSRAKSMSGATSYWNMSLNVSVPIPPPLSRPLIPDEVVDTIDDREVTLKDMLKGAVKGGRNTYQEVLKKQGVPPEKAKETADATWNAITPMVAFIADRANLYAVKPLFLFDVAGLDAPNSSSDGTRVAVGGGVQLTIVVAKLELGYLHTVVRKDGDESGNAFVRLVFQNLY